MNHIFIKLDSFEKIRKFIYITSILDYDLNLVSEKYTVDGKSIMGILSLDLAKEILVNVVNSNQYPKELEGFMTEASLAI